MGAAEPMRYLVFGNSGAGKSTLARRLAAQYDLAHLDLDTIAWKPVGSTNRRPLDEVRTHLAHFMAQHANWVIEGCYADLLALLVDRADALRFLDPPVEVCVAHCRQRPFEPHKYASPAEQDANLPMLVEWVRGYPTREGPLGRPAHEALFQAFGGDKERVGRPSKDASHRGPEAQ